MHVESNLLLVECTLYRVFFEIIHIFIMATRSKNISPVWEHFDKTSTGDRAMCRICRKALSTTGGSTGGLTKHLRLVHGIAPKAKAETETAPLPKIRKQMTMDSLLVPKDAETLPEISKLAALDGIPVHAISRSDYIRKSLDRDGFSLPKNPTDIMKMIQGYADRVRTQMVAEFKQRIDAGERFSLTLDEWTSVRNRRYMNVNLHGTGTDFWNLGL